MTGDGDLTIIRGAYARQIMAAALCRDERVEAAFAAVRREDFLGPGPWPIYRAWRGYVASPSDDPVYLYTDDLVGISPERHINNGQPSLHAHLLASAAPQDGDHVVHVGAGVGYYSALMGELAGPSGRVTAIEYEADLAGQCGRNLAGRPNTTVVHGDGTTVPFDPADVIYVNAGATRPADPWLDRLSDGGRLVLPLTTDRGFLASDASQVQRRGAVFLITRQGEDFLARWISGVAIYPCQGMRDAASERALAVAFEQETWRQVTRLRRNEALEAERCWLTAPGWCLSYD